MLATLSPGRKGGGAIGLRYVVFARRKIALSMFSFFYLLSQVGCKVCDNWNRSFLFVEEDNGEQFH